MTSSKSRLSKTFTFAARNVIVIKVSLKTAQKIPSYHFPLEDKTTFKEGMKWTYLIFVNFRTHQREGIENGKKCKTFAIRRWTPPHLQWHISVTTFREKVWTINLDVLFVRALYPLWQLVQHFVMISMKKCDSKTKLPGSYDHLPIEKIIWNNMDHGPQSDLFVTWQI